MYACRVRMFVSVSERESLCVCIHTLCTFITGEGVKRCEQKLLRSSQSAACEVI